MGYQFYRLLKNAITSYRALDLESDIVGGSHTEGFPIKAMSVLTKHDRRRSTVMAENNEEKKKCRLAQDMSLMADCKCASYTMT